MKPVWRKMGRGHYDLWLGRVKLGYVDGDDSKWVAVVHEDDRVERLQDSTDRKTRREAMAWVESRVTPDAHTVV